MAMSIMNITSKTAYVLAATDGGYTAIQNIGSQDIFVNIAASAPTDTDQGFRLKPLDTITADWGAGNVYIRLTTAGSTIVAISA